MTAEELEQRIRDLEAILDKGYALGVCRNHGLLAVRRSKRGNWYCPLCRQAVPHDMVRSDEKNGDVVPFVLRAEAAEAEAARLRAALEEIRELPSLPETWDAKVDALIVSYVVGEDPWHIAAAALRVTEER